LRTNIRSGSGWHGFPDSNSTDPLVAIESKLLAENYEELLNLYVQLINESGWKVVIITPTHDFQVCWGLLPAMTSTSRSTLEMLPSAIIKGSASHGCNDITKHSNGSIMSLKSIRGMSMLLNNKGMTLRKLGRIEEAHQLFEKVTENHCSKPGKN
jgi:hypothetical protein